MKKNGCIFLCVLLACQLQAATIRVGKQHAINSIKAAIKQSRAGDTILVAAGLYKEGNIVVNKRLVLLGENFPELDGQHKYEVLTITADSTIVKGFRVQHSGHASLDDPGGIKILEANYVVIEGNVLYDNFFGVYVQYGKHCLIKNNTLVAFGKEEQQIGNGVHCWKSDSLQIIGNNISGHRDGIYFEFVTASVIWRNVSAGNIRYGLHFMFSNNDSYFTNTFKNNGAGVAVMYSKQVTMMNNNFEQNWGDAAYGLLLKEISDSYISGNQFRQNTSGIWMEGTSRIKMERNAFVQNGWAMQVQASCMDNLITDNNFIANTFDMGTNGDVVLNTVASNYWDKCEGYDLDRNGFSDVPFRPLSMFSVVVEKNPSAMLLFRSFLVSLLDRSEKIFPSLTPEQFIDKSPRMKPLPL
ncbi:MAG: nitrous oxide reductase family maturation protein NosD [Bacteroidetes bacterium]|uniref:nitrous oxide reductase family maturation protein NosD n=1 Tax=Phnomibacter sp. TaxID=2836217 RepID=UPI002FDDEE30|nr:nitrous oxide reductase family maturation protein NosD [Bacteroidota bacterium]